MKKIVACSAVMLAVVFSGSSMAAPTSTQSVTGQVQGTSETFSGVAMGYGVGAGDLTLSSSMGAKCTGHYFFATPQSGNGVFKCDDGRAGPLNFVSTGTHGSGSSSDQRLSFTFDSGRI